MKDDIYLPPDVESCNVTTADVKNVLFISHAAIDQELAGLLKDAIQKHFPNITVFVSSDPEDLEPGDEWVAKILHYLEHAKLIIALTTERALNRRWVWFEAGAGWRSGTRTIPCCVGKARKSNLPAPFSGFQCLNIDIAEDLEILLGQIEKTFGKARVVAQSLQDIAIELVRLDVRSEEHARILGENRFTKETREAVRKGLKSLTPAEHEAVRLLFVEGDLTDERAVRLIRQSGYAHDSAWIYTAIHDKTNFVRKMWQKDRTEIMLGYQGPWTLNAQLRPLLEDELSKK